MTRVVVIASTLEIAEAFCRKLLPLLERVPLLVPTSGRVNIRGLRNAIVFLVSVELADLPVEQRCGLVRQDIQLIKVLE